jgi:hypothetical protein
MLIAELILLTLYGIWRSVFHPRENRAGAFALLGGLAAGGVSLFFVPDAWIDSWWLYIPILAIVPMLVGFAVDGVARLRKREAAKVGEERFAGGPFLHGFAFAICFLIVRLAA